MENAKTQKPSYSTKTISEAKRLRGRGATHREIATLLKISLGSASLWTRGIQISEQQKSEIQKRKSAKIYTPEKRKLLKQVALKNLVPLLKKFSEEDLLRKIREFYIANNRIPLKREFNMFREYQKRFGSWNNAISAAGFKTNPIHFAAKFTAKDGHKCDSFTEKVIDDWFNTNQIKHSRNINYDATKLTADFLIGKNVLIEFFGLAGVQKNYDQTIERKRALSKKLGYQLIEIYPTDIYPKNYLHKILKEKLN